MNHERVPYATILAAKNGDADAMVSIIQHYRSYIAYFSRRTFYDAYGNSFEFVDDEIRQRIEAKLMYSIIYKFDPTKLPEGETITQ